VRYDARRSRPVWGSAPAFALQPAAGPVLQHPSWAVGDIGYALKVRTAPVHNPPKRQGGLSAPARRLTLHPAAPAPLRIPR
jgi:hypothetical protein